MFIEPAHAYIDPGTSGSLFTVISGALPAILAVIGFLLLPLRRLIKFLLSKFKSEKPQAESE